jgi:hypothetical protein
MRLLSPSVRSRLVSAKSLAMVLGLIAAGMAVAPWTAGQDAASHGPSSHLGAMTGRRALKVTMVRETGLAAGVAVSPGNLNAGLAHRDRDGCAGVWNR